MEWLSVKGDKIVDGSGSTFRLQGIGLGGWLNLENFISGFPGNEAGCRRALLEAMGEDSYRAFFDTYEEVFFSDADARYLVGLGCNSVRIPFNYRHLEDDSNPFEIIDAGLRKLDRAIDICERAGLYVILDLHALPGAQNQHWHSDNPVHKALFWEYSHFQDRVAWLWRLLAERYRDRSCVAGYNLINEPADPQRTRLDPYYRRLEAEIRQVDDRHILFLDGDKYGTDFSVLTEPLENAVYAPHDYALPGMRLETGYPSLIDGVWQDREAVRQSFLRRTEYMRRHNLPIWVGEFGPLYTGDPELDAQRFALLGDQLDIYKEAGASWSLWTYKDIGLQGLQCVSVNSSYMQLTAGARQAKARLGGDSWGGTDNEVRHVIEPITRLIAKENPDFQPFPWGRDRWIALLVRNIMFSEALQERFAASFKGISPDTARQLASCFAFENCVEREDLARLLRTRLSQAA